MQEKQIEQKLVREVKNRDGFCIKLMGMVGIPDRLILMPGGKIGFVEVKAPGKKPRAIQIKRMKQLSALGFLCFVLDDVVQIGGVIHAIQST